jgi:hypothetical protein
LTIIGPTVITLWLLVMGILLVRPRSREPTSTRWAGEWFWPVGALAEIGCLSFKANKIVTYGGDGMLVTDDASAAA